jgi:hypothetical protein
MFPDIANVPQEAKSSLAENHCLRGMEMDEGLRKVSLTFFYTHLSKAC